MRPYSKRGIDGGCQIPIGASAHWNDNKLEVHAIVARPDGSLLLREHGSGDNAVQLGEAVANSLMRQGGSKILDDVYSTEVPVARQP